MIDFLSLKSIFLNKFALKYSGLNLNQDKATKPQTVQIVRQGEATPYWFKFN
ncbi:transposase, partial [Neisseria meningitidis]